MKKYQIDVAKVRTIQGEIWGMIKSTFLLRKGIGKPDLLFGHYGGLFSVGDEKLVIHTDGVGTKLLLAEKLKKYDTVGIDAVAMSVNDVLCLGAESLVGVDYIALREEDPLMVRNLMKGLVEGAKQSDCGIIGGETAIVKEMLAPGAFDLTFTVVGRVIKLTTGENVGPGMKLLGLESSGIHSNGYTLARTALDIDKWGMEMLEPTKIYVKPVLAALDKYPVYGIAHITGGSFSKLVRLSKKYKFIINMDSMPRPQPIFRALWDEVEDTKEMFRTFNMGIGMVMVLKEEDVEGVKSILKEKGVNSWVIGETTEGKGVFLKEGKKETQLSF